MLLAWRVQHEMGDESCAARARDATKMWDRTYPIHSSAGGSRSGFVHNGEACR